MLAVLSSRRLNILLLSTGLARALIFKANLYLDGPNKSSTKGI